MVPSSPVVALWLLVRLLRMRRLELGIDVKTITQELSFSRNYWSAIEHERTIISADNLAKLAKLLKFGRDETTELMKLRETAKGHGWWSDYSEIIDADVQRLFGLEQGARAVRSYESLLVPGLLQSPDYARAVIDPAVTIASVEVEERVELRLRRQARLGGDHPLHLRVLISEAVLRQQIGGLSVLQGQLDHLLRMIDENPKTLDLRVIPFSAQMHNLLGAGTLYILDFENPRLPTIAWQETVSTWGVIDEVNQVRDIVAAFDQATDRAISRAASRDLIQRHRKEFG